MQRREFLHDDTIRPAGYRHVLNIKDIDYPFRWCPAGTFLMGSPMDEPERNADETLHQVTLTTGFWILETSVTQTMWESITGSNPSLFRDNGKLPVECVSWIDCQDYIQSLNDMRVAPTGYRFSLPTESQWEYACRAGTATPFHFGNTLSIEQANCSRAFPFGITTQLQCLGLDKTSEVSSYPANAWGLYDTHGNVEGWCLDWYGHYPSGSVTDPVGASSGIDRVFRGGAWSNAAELCRSASRGYVDESSRCASIGVRLVLIYGGQIAPENPCRERKS